MTLTFVWNFVDAI